MDLTTYQNLTGTTVPANEVNRVTAMFNRTRSILEIMLGYTLDPAKAGTNLYNELGKSTYGCACSSIDLQNLQPPDPVIGSYRLFRYNVSDQYMMIDPATKINSVKLVYVRTGEAPNGVTLVTYTDEQIRLQMSHNNFTKYLENCVHCLCNTNCRGCVQLAVDATWTNQGQYPDDLLYVWADMIGFYADDKTGIRSESIDTHSYTRFDNNPPEVDPKNLAILKKYAGPNGSIMSMPI